MTIRGSVILAEICGKASRRDQVASRVNLAVCITHALVRQNGSTTDVNLILDGYVVTQHGDVLHTALRDQRGKQASQSSSLIR